VNRLVKRKRGRRGDCINVGHLYFCVNDIDFCFFLGLTDPLVLGPLHTRHFCSRYCDKKDIVIKRYKTIFIQYFFPVCIEYIYFFGTILNILKCHYNILKKKYLFIKMSFYLFIKILCSKMSSVYKP
jgi:hypothetical protein